MEASFYTLKFLKCFVSIPEATQGQWNVQATQSRLWKTLGSAFIWSKGIFLCQQMHSSYHQTFDQNKTSRQKVKFFANSFYSHIASAQAAIFALEWNQSTEAWQHVHSVKQKGGQ